MPQTGEGKTGEATTGESAESFTYIGEPTGHGKTGEEPTGGTAIQQLVIAAPKRTLDIQRKSHDVTGAGTAATAAPKQTLAFEFGENKIGYPQWVIAGQAIRVQSVTLTPTELSLDVRARSDAERTLLDTLDDNAGSLDTRERADGTTVGRDTAAGANTYTVYPPIRHLPERVTREWLVENVTRDRTSADTRATAATVDLVASETRDPVTGYTDASDSGSWTFDFNGGRIVTPRVANPTQGETTTLDVILTAEQAELFETLTAAVAGSVVQTVPDGETFTRDTTPSNRQSVTLTPPADATDPPLSGDYVIEGWTSEGSDGAAYRVSMQLSTRYESG